MEGTIAQFLLLFKKDEKEEVKFSQEEEKARGGERTVPSMKERKRVPTALNLSRDTQ